MVRKGILAVFEGKQKGTITSKPEELRPPKLVCMHLTSTPTCMNFLSQFQATKFFDDHGLYSPWSEGKFWPFLKANKKEP